MGEEECCPKFDPKPWNGKIFKWKNKKFIKDKVFTIFYMPINFGSVIKKLMEKINSANAKCIDWMGLSDHTSKWNMNIYVAVNKKIPNAENVSFKSNGLLTRYTSHPNPE